MDASHASVSSGCKSKRAEPVLTVLQLHYFHINFIVSFVAITAVSVIGNITLDVRIVTLGLPILITEFCAQLLVMAILARMRIKIAFRVSSVPAGRVAQSGMYVVAEDIVAVDAGEGQTHRKQLMNPYNASIVVRKLCHELDLFWGVTSTLFGAGTIIAVLAALDADLSYILGKFALANRRECFEANKKIGWSLDICCCHGIPDDWCM